MIHHQAAYPSWLNIGELAIAGSLIEVGFIYAGLSKDFYIDRQLYLATYHGWDFYSSKNEVVLDAVCKEALYLYPLDVENVSAFSVLKRAKSAIEIQIMKQPSKSQLTTFKSLFKPV